MTAIVTTGSQLAACQFTARAFGTAESMLAVVVITEAVPAACRSWAMAVHLLCGALGYGLGTISFATIGASGPDGWRICYILGACFCGVLAVARRHLPETVAFAKLSGPGHAAAGCSGLLLPVKTLLGAAESRWRVLVLCAVYLPASFGLSPASQMTSKYLQSERGLSQQEVSAVFLVCGPVAFLLAFLLARASDKLGRRVVATGSCATSAMAYFVFYTPSAPLRTAVLCMTVALSSYVQLSLQITTLTVELFPTQARATATGVSEVLWTAGGSAGLLVESELVPDAGSPIRHSPAVRMLVLVALAAVASIFSCVPETARVQLDDVHAGAEAQSGPLVDAVQAPLRASPGGRASVCSGEEHDCVASEQLGLDG